MQGTSGMTQLQQSNQAVAVAAANGQLNGGCSTLFLTGFPEHDFKNMSFAFNQPKQQQQQQPVTIVDLVEKQQLLLKRSTDENLSTSDKNIKRLRHQ
ncbi:unnamed protein product [Rotaria sp. Silwood2]|nr:unnamed protein product [Rotaria sp. Silwood2]CAF2758071.1 unnamed protein product [Rotaria sp. Silwood2]CAF3174821.1 unnamed protein product [Rotaria sp. Silwood2]